MLLSSAARRNALFLALAAASWGLGTVISKRAVTEIPPLQLLVVQLGCSVVALSLGLMLERRRRPGREARPVGCNARLLDRIGLLNPGASYALGLIGLTQISASLSVLLWAGEPLLILALAWRWLHEPVGNRLVALSGAGLVGMVLVLWSPGLTGQAAGIVVSLVGVACCAVYSVLTRRWLPDAPSTTRIVLGQQAWALGLALGLFAASVLAGRSGATATAATAISAQGWASAVVSGLLYYAIAYGFYLRALRRVRASVAAAAFYLIPVFGVGGGWALLGERLEPIQLVGAVIVVLGVGAIAASPAVTGGTGAASADAETATA